MEVKDLPKEVVLQTIKDKGRCKSAYYSLDGQDVFCKTDNTPMRNNIGFYMYTKASTIHSMCDGCPVRKGEYCSMETVLEKLITFAQEHYPVDLYKLLVKGE